MATKTITQLSRSIETLRILVERLSNGTPLSEFIADTVGAMFTGNTESGVTATYQDSDNTIDLSVDGEAFGLSLLQMASAADLRTALDIFPATYTPTLTHVTNVTASTAFLTSYLRVGNAAIVFGRVDIDPTAVGSLELDVSFPIASTISDSGQCRGILGNSGANNVGVIAGDVANNRASFLLNAINAGNLTYTFHFEYTIQ